MKKIFMKINKKIAFLTLLGVFLFGSSLAVPASASDEYLILNEIEVEMQTFDWATERELSEDEMSQISSEIRSIALEIEKIKNEYESSDYDAQDLLDRLNEQLVKLINIGFQLGILQPESVG
jgi:hypothetical protein